VFSSLSGGSTNVVSARLNSAAIACICDVDSPVPSATTASGLPPNCRSVNTSTVTNSTCMSLCNSVDTLCMATYHLAPDSVIRYLANWQYVYIISRHRGCFRGALQRPASSDPGVAKADQLKLGSLVDRKVARLLALQKTTQRFAKATT